MRFFALPCHLSMMTGRPAAWGPDIPSPVERQIPGTAVKRRWLRRHNEATEVGVCIDISPPRLPVSDMTTGRLPSLAGNRLA